jgi:hypothetical protein
VTITEGIPAMDMARVVNYIKNTQNLRAAALIGPNCPGVISPSRRRDWISFWATFFAMAYIISVNATIVSDTVSILLFGRAVKLVMICVTGRY